VQKQLLPLVAKRMPTYIIILYLISSGALLSLAFLALKKDNKSPENLAFSAFSLVSVFWMLFLYLGFYWGTFETVHLSTLFFRLCFGFGFLMPFFLPIFFYYFLKKTFGVPKILSSLYFLGGVFVFFAAAFTPYVYESAVIVTEKIYIEDILGSYYTIFTYCFLFGMLLTLAFVIRKNLQIKEKIKRKKLLIASWGAGTFIFVLSMTNLILPAFGILVFQLESGAFSLFFSLPTFYAIYKYRFLDIRLALDKTLSYATTFGVYGIIFTAVLKAFHQSSPPPYQETILITALVVIAAVLWKKTFHAIHTLWNYVFYQNKFNPIDQIRAVPQKLNTSLSTGLDELSEILGVKQAEFIPTNGTSKFPEIQQFFAGSPSNDLVREEIDYELKQSSSRSHKNLRSIKKEMDQYMIAAAIPVLDDDKNLLGILLLEQKLKPELFSSQEIKATKIMLQNATIYIGKGEKYNQLQENLSNLDPKTINKEFLTSFMHEVQHPLMMARNVREMIEWEKLNPEDQSFLEESEKSITDLAHKLERISEAVQWQSQLIPLEKSFLSFEAFVEITSRNCKNKEQIDITISPKKLGKKLFYFDTHQFKKACCAIVKNGLFFNENKNPKIRINITEKSKNLVIDFTDNGVGIPPENWEKIFDLLFVTSESRNPAEAGLGVGLTIARGIIQAHGGNVKVHKSTVEEGATMRISIPLENLQEPK
jgi:signal transduction histidine kinase